MRAKKYSNETGDLLQFFMDLAAKVKYSHSYPDGCLVIEGFESGDADVYWQCKDGTKKPL